MAKNNLNAQEQALKYMYDHNITSDNFSKHSAFIRSMFSSEKDYELFVDNCVAGTTHLSCNSYLKPGQHIDAFEHIRYIIQEQHTHDFLEIKCMLKGIGLLHIDGNVFMMKESDICFISPFTPHSSAIFDSDAQMVNIVIPVNYITDLFTRILKLDHPVSRILRSTYDNTELHEPYLYYSMAIDYKSGSIIHELADYYMRSKTFTETGYALSEANLEAMLLNTISNDPGQIASTDINNNLLKKIMLYIEQNLSTANLSGLANYMKYSESYTSRFIKKNTNRTFNEIIKIMKLKKAAELLQNTDMTIEEIMHIIGVSGKTNFYNNFKDYYKMTPYDFRNK